MPVKTIKKDCSHSYVATKKKGKWDVRVISMSNRENFSLEEVTTTIFECSLCGAKKEFPDNWEKNYVAPEKPSRELAQPKTALKIPAAKRVRPAVKKALTAKA